MPVLPVAAPHRLVKCVANGSVNAVRRFCGVPIALHLGVQLFQVLRFEPAETVRADAGNEVLRALPATDGAAASAREGGLTLK